MSFVKDAKNRKELQRQTLFIDLEGAELVCVSPDMGGIKRTRALAKQVGAPIAIIDKRRDKHNSAIACNIIGDVKELQETEKDTARARKKNIAPPLKADPALRTAGLKTGSNEITYVKMLIKLPSSWNPTTRLHG